MLPLDRATVEAAVKVRTLGSNRDIRELIETGVRVVLDAFVIYYRHAGPGAEIEPALAIQISRRHGNAIRRNLIRRRVKEICRIAFARFQEGGDFVFIARTKVAQRSFQEIRALIEGFFEREGFLTPEGGQP